MLVTESCHHAFVLSSLVNNSFSEVDQCISIMALNLAVFQHHLICDIIISKLLKKNAQITEVACCSTHLIKHIQFNLCCFSTIKVSLNDDRYPQFIIHSMLMFFTKTWLRDWISILMRWWSFCEMSLKCSQCCLQSVELWSSSVNQKKHLAE